MLLNLALFTGLFIASEVLAVPAGIEGNIARRREGRQSHPGNILEANASSAGFTAGNIYSYNWAGAVWAQPSGTFTTVTGTFTVPTPSGSPGDGAAVWVGIDGSTCNSAILQTGVQLIISGDGTPAYNGEETCNKTPWYEWFPAGWTDFSGITISAGDSIQLTVQAFSATSGIAVVDNLTNGQQVSEYLTSSSPLCGQDAEWIVEDYSVGGSPVPFANFGTVTFSSAQAGSYTPSGADIWTIVDSNGQAMTSASTSGSSVTITYV